MGIAERKLRQKEEMKSSILEAAWKLVQQDGWQSLSIRKIADAIEYSVPVIYYHFENKEAILLEFTREGFQLLTQKVSEARDETDQVDQQLMRMGKAYRDFAFGNVEYYQLMFGLGIPTCDMVNSIEEVKAFSNTLIEVVQKAIAQSNDPEADYWLKFHTYWSILHGLVSIQMIGDQGKYDPRNELVLQDAITGFIGTLKL